MTTEKIARAVYEISGAASTQREARLGGAELGKMIAARSRSQVSARTHLGIASHEEIENCIRQLAISNMPHFADAAAAALEARREDMRRPEKMGQ